MNSILKSWYENGFKTAEDVKAGDKKESVESSFDADEFFEAAVKRSMNT
jgi:DNA replication protein DnaD